MRELGAHIFISHDKANVREAHYLVVSSAIPASNPEIIAAKENPANMIGLKKLVDISNKLFILREYVAYQLFKMQQATLDLKL